MGSRRTYVALRRRAAIALGVWAVAFSLLTFVAAIPDGLNVTLAATPLQPHVDETVVFNASVHRNDEDSGGPHFSYRFTFGDGSGTDWQAASNTTHAYTSSGNYTVTVQVKDRHGRTGSASVTVSVVPPPPPAPDVRPVLADLLPAEPETGAFANLTVVLLNRGTATAATAVITVTDRRPDGTSASLGMLPMPAPLVPMDVVPITFGPFRAAVVGNHTLQVRVSNVSPAEPCPACGVLNLTMRVVPSSVPPPPPAAPQLQILAGLLDPSHAREGQWANLSAILWNRGTAAAKTATLSAYDVRPNGSVEFLGTVPLRTPVLPSSGITLALSPFVASGAGNHTIRLVLANVTPPQISAGGTELDLRLNVTSAGTTPPPPNQGPPPLEFGLAAVALAGAAVASGAGAAWLLTRPRPHGPLEPPPAVPPDRSPPPIWPP